MSSSEPSNSAQHELVAEAVRGNGDALSTLLAKFGPSVEQGLRIGRQWQNVIDSSDVMQVTYLEAFLQIPSFRPDNAGSFEAWLRRIAENNLRDAIRGLERQKQPPPSRRIQHAAPGDDSHAGLYEQLAATSSTPSRAVGRQDVRRLIESAIDKLPPDYARTIRLYDLEGRTIGEVAKAMERSSGAVHMMRVRAHERLAELLETASVWFKAGA